METFFAIGSTILAVVFLIAWIATSNQKKKDQALFINRISYSDTELAKLYESKHILEENFDQQLRKNNSIETILKNQKKHIEVLQEDQKFLKELDKTSMKMATDYKEQLRVSKGNHTRYKNRDIKNKKVIKDLVAELEKHGVKYLGTSIGKEGHSSIFKPITKAIDKQELCNCMNPHKGVGDRCKNCRKIIK